VNEVVSLIGLPDDNRARVLLNRGSISDIEISIPGTNSINELIDKQIVPYTTVTLGGSKPVDINLGQPKLILNTVCEPDSNLEALKQANELIKPLNVPVLNHPDILLKTTRDNIYKLFNGTEGIRVPKTLRIAPKYLGDVEKLIQDGVLAVPLIFRQAGLHNGLLTFLLETPDQLPELEQFAFDGRDYYVTEFADYRSQDGLYRKARFFIIDGKTYARHLLVSRHWNIHSGSRKELMENDLDLQEEEKKFLSGPNSEILRHCQSIYEKLKLDFFGIDCHISDDNELLIFEINACMRSHSDSRIAYHEQTHILIQEAIMQMLTKRLGDV